MEFLVKLASKKQKVRKLLIFAILIFHCYYLYGQETTNVSPNDSVGYYLSNLQLEKAIELLDRKIDEKASADIYLTRALVKIELESYESAMADLRSSLRMMPGNDTAYYNIGYIMYLQGAFEKSIEYYDSALTYNANNPFYLSARGDSFLELDKLNLAMADYQMVSAVDSLADLGYYGIAMCHFFSEEYDSARYYLSFAVSIDPFDPDYFYQRAMCKYLLGEDGSSLDDLNYALDIDPGFFEAWVLSAQIYLENDMPDDALAALNEALFLDNSDMDVLQERASLLIDYGDYQQAYDDYNIVLSQEADNDIAYFNRGLAAFSWVMPKEHWQILTKRFHWAMLMRTILLTAD
jgi:tetratricopeptide (TPR) repeat protein